MNEEGKITIVTYEEISLLLALTVNSNQLTNTQLNIIEETLSTHTQPFIIEIISGERPKPKCILRLPIKNQFTHTQFEIIKETLLATQTEPPHTLNIWG